MEMENIKFVSVVLMYVALAISACKSGNGADKKVVEMEGDEIVGRILLVPDSMEAYKPFKEYPSGISKLKEGGMKIYTLVDVSCSSCIQNIKNWDLLSNLFIKENVPIFMICQSKDGFELFKYFCESGKVARFAFPFFLDKKSVFLKQNSFLSTITYPTILLDENDKILSFGDPTHSKEVLDKYLAKIAELNKKKKETK